jgi:hypothetical protein
MGALVSAAQRAGPLPQDDTDSAIPHAPNGFKAARVGVCSFSE